MNTQRVQRIHRTLTEVFDLARTAAFDVDMADFGDWLAALDRTEFYVSRREHGPGLFAHWAGMWDGHYIAVHAKDVLSVLGQDIPEYGKFLTLPASEAVNLRGAGQVTATPRPANLPDPVLDDRDEQVSR
jgi:hypothetical protein